MKKPFAKTKSALLIILAAGMIGAIYGAYCGIIIANGNFHEVQNGILYRSAQLDKNMLAEEIKNHHIKSILNLRGANAGSSWYDDELSLAQKYHVTHYDIGISAYRKVDVKKINEILNILRDASKPLLIHCRSGADRAGLVSALYVYAIEHQSADAARQQLSLFYGHFPYLVSKSDAMDKSFDEYLKLNPLR